MKGKGLWLMWGGLFIVCAGLGFIPEPSGVLGGAMKVLSVLFFLPPAVLLHRAGKEGDVRTRHLIRNISALSLLLTLVLLVANFLGAMGPEFLGSVLHYMLIIVSSPMVCSGYWALSLFLWACLLLAAIK